MLSRRTFLRTSIVTLVLVPVACGSGDDGPRQSIGTTTPPCDGVSSTSTMDDGHTHALCVPESDLTSPPTEGRTYATTLDDGHTHAVSFTQEQLRAVAAGQAVTLTSSTDDRHAHSFSVSRAAARVGGGGGSSGIY